MARDSIRKRCVDCRRTIGGTRGKPQWCPDCGGELRELPYRPHKRVKRAV